MDLSFSAFSNNRSGYGNLSSYIRLSNEAMNRRKKILDMIIEQRRMPLDGIDDSMIEMLIQHLSWMDSNNFAGNVGAGEREARIASDLVRKRYYGLGHGMGRSGELDAVQPKAAGSSIICKLTNEMVLDLMRKQLGMKSLEAAMVVPLATGMSLSLVFSTLRNRYISFDPKDKSVVSQSSNQAVSASSTSDSEQKIINDAYVRKTKVIMTRIDQKTCPKSIISAGLIPVIVENVIDGDAVRCDIQAIENAIIAHGIDSILCIMSTTSCFAPRLPDDVVEIAKLSARHNIPHVINNAYGLQCNKICDMVENACRIQNGVFAIVQSTDKNFLVPVGGAIITGPNKNFLQNEVSKLYPGRASISPILDLFITLLSLGINGYMKLRKERIDLIEYFKESVQKAVSKFGERLLISKRNTISFAVSLSRIPLHLAKPSDSATSSTKDSSKTDIFDEDAVKATEFGSMLFTRGVSGARVIESRNGKSMFGASTNEYPISYFTVACAIGITKDEIDKLCSQLNTTLIAWDRLKEKKLKINTIDIDESNQEEDNNIEVEEQTKENGIQEKSIV